MLGQGRDRYAWGPAATFVGGFARQAGAAPRNPRRLRNGRFLRSAASGGGTGIARDAPELGLFRFRSGRPLPPVVVYLVDETGNVMDAQIEKFLRWQAWHPAARQWIACCRGVAAEAV